MDMIASVMTTRRAGRPIDFHIPRRLNSMAGDFLRNSLPERCNRNSETLRGPCTGRRTEHATPLPAVLGAEKAAEPTQADPRCQREPEGECTVRFLDCPTSMRSR